MNFSRKLYHVSYTSQGSQKKRDSHTILEELCRKTDLFVCSYDTEIVPWRLGLWLYRFIDES